MMNREHNLPDRHLLTTFGISDIMKDVRICLSTTYSAFEIVDVNELVVEWIAYFWKHIGLLEISADVVFDELLSGIDHDLRFYKRRLTDQYHFIRHLYSKLNLNPDTAIYMVIRNGTVFVYME